MGMLGLNSRGAKETEKSGNYGSGRRKRRFKSGIFEEDLGIFGISWIPKIRENGKSRLSGKIHGMRWVRSQDRDGDRTDKIPGFSPIRSHTNPGKSDSLKNSRIS